MAEVCHRSGKKVYAADNPVRIGGMVFHPATFTCKATGAKLTLKTCVIGVDAEGQKDVYLAGQEPKLKPTPSQSVIDSRVASVPDSNMRTTDRMFNVAGKGANRGTGGEDLGSRYGEGSVQIETATNAPKVPTTVDNANKMEKMHNGASYTNAAANE